MRIQEIDERLVWCRSGRRGARGKGDLTRKKRHAEHKHVPQQESHHCEKDTIWRGNYRIKGARGRATVEKKVRNWSGRGK